MGSDGHDARNGGTEHEEDGAFTGGDCLEYVRGEVWDQVGVLLEAVPGLRKDFSEEDEGG